MAEKLHGHIVYNSFEAAAAYENNIFRTAEKDSLLRVVKMRPFRPPVI